MKTFSPANLKITTSPMRSSDPVCRKFGRCNRSVEAINSLIDPCYTEIANWIHYPETSLFCGSGLNPHGIHFYKTTRWTSNHTRASAALSGQFRAGEERKSTRLNSSHVAISYGVRCL